MSIAANGVARPAAPHHRGGPSLSTCEVEPIHIPGSIQPHGALLALSEPGLVVLQASRNVDAMLGRDVEEVLGRSIGEVLGPGLDEALRGALENPSLGRQPLYLATTSVGLGGGYGRRFGVIVHRSGARLVVELEPAGAGDSTMFRDLYPMVRSFLARLEDAPGVLEVCGIAAAEVRRISGFNRVLVYRFDEDWNGTVIAEDRDDVLPSYLDLRFPASDIPEQARALYRANRLRLIADAGYRPVPIEPLDDPTTDEPLDLSFATLRSVSPVHVEYMRNMGTGASLSISILKDGELWGLISCHDRDPRVVPFEARTALDVVGQVMSLQVVAKEQRAEAEFRIGRQAAYARLLAAMTAADDFVEGLARVPEDLLGMVSAGGAAIVHEGHCRLVGEAPDEEQVARIADWLAREVRDDVFAVDSMADRMPWAEGFKDEASGLLAVAISKLHRGYVLWFRPELIRAIRWGGDPNKPIEVARDGRIHPRKSFEAWKETVSLRSSPWRAAEVEAADGLRDAIVGIVLRRAEERAQLVAELERSNKELEAFSYSVSHDLRAPFRHIVGYAEMLREEEAGRMGAEGQRYLGTIIESAQFAGTLVDNLLAFSRMGRTTVHPVPIDMNSVTRDVVREVAAEAGPRQIDWEIGELPPVEGDLMMIRLAMANLVSNAVKYTRPRDRAVVAITGEIRGGEAVFTVRDNGIGFDMKYADKLFGVFQRLHRMEEFEGTGIGLANVRRIMSRHGGRAWGEGVPDGGATFSIALPRLGTHGPADDLGGEEARG